ncbi:MAG: glycosyltransferase [Actinomycetota bacterium]
MTDPRGRRVVALVAARNEADAIGSTVRSLHAVAGVTEVVVVDDASDDATAAEAAAAGARVLRSDRHRGKGGALEGALSRLRAADVWLLADGDLGTSATAIGAVLRPVLGDEADLAIGVLPSQGGGLGVVKWLSGFAIARSCGFRSRAPLSGQRAITGLTLSRVRPLANGFGVEAAMTIDAVRSGARVLEVAADLRHRTTGRDLAGFAHRGRQGLDIFRVVFARMGGRR